MTKTDMLLMWALYGLLAGILLTGVMLEYCYRQEALKKAKGCETVKYRGKK